METQENIENKQLEKKLANTEIPEYVEGIPTEKKKVKECFALIKSYYERLWKDLQRKTGGNSIHNKFLDADVYIVKNESDKKTHPISLAVIRDEGGRNLPHHRGKHQRPSASSYSGG